MRISPYAAMFQVSAALGASVRCAASAFVPPSSRSLAAVGSRRQYVRSAAVSLSAQKNGGKQQQQQGKVVFVYGFALADIVCARHMMCFPLYCCATDDVTSQPTNVLPLFIIITNALHFFSL